MAPEAMSTTPSATCTLASPAAGYRCAAVVSSSAAIATRCRRLTGDSSMRANAMCRSSGDHQKPGVPVHLLLGDEFRGAVADDAAAVVRQRMRGALAQVADVQILIEHVRDVVAAGRDRGVGRVSLAAREPLRRRAGGISGLDEVQLAVSRHHQGLSGCRERIVQDARQRRRTLALASRLLLLREGLPGRGEGIGINQQSRLAGGDIVFPQVEPVLVPRLALQVRDARVVRRHLEAGDRRSCQRRRVEQPIDRQFLRAAGRHDRTGDCRNDEAQGADCGPVMTAGAAHPHPRRRPTRLRPRRRECCAFR